jgi:hypothetical protein
LQGFRQVLSWHAVHLDVRLAWAMKTHPSSLACNFLPLYSNAKAAVILNLEMQSEKFSLLYLNASRWWQCHPVFPLHLCLPMQQESLSCPLPD